MKEFRFKLNIWDKVELTKDQKMVKVIYQQKTQALRAFNVNEKFITVRGF